jgi:hypothetical protein
MTTPMRQTGTSAATVHPVYYTVQLEPFMTCQTPIKNPGSAMAFP